MPAHRKRQRGTTTTSPSAPPPPPLEAERGGGSVDNHDREPTESSSDSDGSSYSSDVGEEEQEFIDVKLAEIRKEFQCPICLGIIRKTRTVMECLHRFCRQCIDKSMRLGNNECPACRTHCASRRSLRDDPNYDALIAALYPDIDKYEEEELAFQEEEKSRNKQIQDSIAETSRKQAEALGRKRASSRAPRQNAYRNLRARKNARAVEHDESDEDEEGANGRSSKDSSSSDEKSMEVKSRRKYRKSKRARSSQPSSGPNAGGGCDDNHDSDVNRELPGTSAGPVGSNNLRGWGRGRLRSSLRNNDGNCANKKSRLFKLVDYLRSLNENEEELKLSVMIISLHEDKIPSLKRPYLSCSPTSSVGQLCQYVAMQTSVAAAEVEMLMLKKSHPVKYSPNAQEESVIFDPSHHEVHLLNEHQNLEEIHAKFFEINLVLAYRLKERSETDEA